MIQAVPDLLTRMAGDATDLIERRGLEDPLIVGIRTGGVWVAEVLRERLDLQEPVGIIDITFYRDDFSRIGLHPQVKPSQLPLSLDDRHIILVDDVLHTGRTIRAALNEIFDYGRPASVTLAVLVERDGRELPVEAAIVGQHADLDARHHVKLSGPDPLALSIIEADAFAAGEKTR
ncbi:MAG: bifunctional pyr operon transcriptional regulator/uracil phosphoribosyltransferase PyrR [Gammaproteobacteria bacterium]